MATYRTLEIGVVANVAQAAKQLKVFSDKFKGFAKALENRSSSIGKKLEKLKNIIVYRLLRQGISKLIQGLQEGKENIIAYDKALNGTSWSKASVLMQSLKDSALLLKNTFASLFMTLLASVQPAINVLVTGLIRAINVINQFVSALMGRTGYTKAVEGISNVTKAAGQLKRTLLGFDEINRLDGEGGGGGEDMSKMFEEAAIETRIQSIADKIRGMFSFLDTDTLIKGLKVAGAIIAGWQITKGLADFVGFMKSPSGKITIGATLLILGVSGLKGALEKALTDGFTAESIAGAVLSTGAIVGGGALIGSALGNAIIGGCIGGIAAGGVFLWAGIKSQLENGMTSTSTFITALGGTLVGAFFGFLIGGPVGAGIGALIGLAVSGLVTLGIDIATHLDEWKQRFADGMESIKRRWEMFKTTFLAIWNVIKLNIQNGITAISAAWEGLKTTVSAIWNSLYLGAQKYLKPIVDLVEKLKTKWDEFKNANGGGFGLFNLLSQVGMFANGGSVPTGDLFIANEQGPELVGSVGGRTTVTNQDQFVAGMEAANEPVVQAILSAANAIIGTVNSKNYTVELDGAKVSKQIYSAMNSEGMRRGTSLAWGQ
jgi:hypothetical protein